MSEAIAIEVREVSKRYPRDRRPMRVLARTLARRTEGEGFDALETISFSVPRGSAVGIVGRNGSGKSTLLQVICGTLSPSAGTVATHGRVAAMLELGAGFNPDFTGRENVFLAASIYGLDDREIAARFDAIEAFAEIGEYIDRPVSEYSSGMYARLAFAVCAHVDADILVVDEILGVGDAAFQRKCQGFMQAFRKTGTLVFVSHNAGAVLSACERAIWIENGRIMADGDAAEVLRLYMEAEVTQSYMTDVPSAQNAALDHAGDIRLGDRNLIDVSPFDPDCQRHGLGGTQIRDCYFSQGDGERLHQLRGGDLVTLHIEADVTEELESPIFGYMFRNVAGQNLFGDNTFLAYRKRPPTAPAGSRIEARISFRMPLLPRGRYSLAPSIIAGTQSSHVPVNWLEDALILTVAGEAIRHGKVGMMITGFSVTQEPHQ